MRAGRNRNGFVMLETMLVIVILMTISSALLSTAFLHDRNMKKRSERNRAYDAALCALRLMTEELTSEETGPETEYIEAGMDPVNTEVNAQPENGMEPVSFPVTVWSVRDGERLILYAESEAYGYQECLSVELRKQEHVAEATPSDMTGWMVVKYGRGQESEVAR